MPHVGAVRLLGEWVHYYLKDNQYYVLLTKEQFDDMKVLMDHAGYYYLHLEDGVGYRW